MSDLDGARAEAVAREIRSAHGDHRAIGTACDVRDYEAVNAWIAHVFETFEGIDVLVNNAGDAREGPFVDSTPDGWDYDIGICLYGVIHGLHAALPRMIERGGGRIVNCCSDAGRVGERNFATYSAAKDGVVALTRAVANEVALQGIYLNCVCFGMTMTEMMQELLDEETQRKDDPPLPDGSARDDAGPGERDRDLSDRTSYFRNDLFVDGLPASLPPAMVQRLKNPHVFLTRRDPSLSAPIAQLAQEQIADFFATDGTVTTDPDGAGPLFEVPIAGAPPGGTEPHTLSAHVDRARGPPRSRVTPRTLLAAVERINKANLARIVQ